MKIPANDDVTEVLVNLDGARLSSVLVEVTRDICQKTGRDPAEGTSMLLLAAVMIYHRFARDRQAMPEAMSLIIADMAKTYLREIEESHH